MKKARRFWSLVLFVALVLQVFNFAPAASTNVSAAGEEYGLPANTKDGLIFHAWNWSFDTIKNNLPALAAAGFKSVQTSPIQGTKESTMAGSYWWVLYQPINFNIGNVQLGSRDQFKQLCEEAEKYGISIIVDVVANHTANAGGGSLQFTPAYNVDSSIRNNPSFWHEARGIDSYDNRWQVTQWGIGLPDLNTSNQELQNKVIAFLNDAISLGADGFRYDAAKHIELPEDPGGSNFWPRVLGSLSNQSLFHYGEVLQGGADNINGYANYMSVTPSSFGHNVREAVGFGSSKNVDKAKAYTTSVPASKLVTWVESHDTYANDGNESTAMNDWQIKMGWAMIASRADSTALFFNRPAGGGKFASSLGAAGNTLWQDADVAAVNKFHNAMVGQGEYVRTQGNEIMLVERGTKGMTIVNLGGDAYINSTTNLANGTYTNKASGGGTFTVSNGKITGNIGGGKIAVLYEAGPQVPTISIDQQEGGFYADSIAVKVNVTNANNASYTVNDGAAVSFSSSTTATLGAGAALGTTFTLKVTATNAAGTSTKTYTFTKEDPNAALVVHYYKPSSWGTPNMYYYDDSVTPTKNGPAWPGVAMTNEGNGWYTATISGWNKAKIIFNSNGNQMPAAQQPGYQVTGEKWIKNGVITPSNPDVTVPTISIDKAEGAFNSESLDVTISYQGANAATYSVNGASPVSFTSGTKVTIGAGDANGTTYTLNVIATNSSGNTSKSYSFTKQVQPQGEGLKVHFYKPSNWGTPNVYYYDDTVSPVKIGSAWPGVAMQSEGNGWYVANIPNWSQAKVIFNSNGNQIPAAQQAGYLVSGEKWIKDGVIHAANPDVVTPVNPTVSINKSEGAFNSESLEVTISYQDADSATYSLNGAAPVSFTSGSKVTIGAGDANGSEYTLTVTASNSSKSTTKTYSFIKQKAQEKSFTVRFYKPANWGTPNIYFYDESVSPTKQGSTWPGIAMQNDGNGWYSYTISGWDKANVIFNSNGQQTPGASQAGYLVTADSWIKDGVVSTVAPGGDNGGEETVIPVTFNVRNASTVPGQNVYIVGNTAELGNWSPASAIGPGSATNYPNWSITINLPVGTTDRKSVV